MAFRVQRKSGGMNNVIDKYRSETGDEEDGKHTSRSCEQPCRRILLGDRDHRVFVIGAFVLCAASEQTSEPGRVRKCEALNRQELPQSRASYL